MKIAFWLSKRLTGIALQLLVISFVAFSLLHLAPGSPEQILLGPNSPTPESLAAIRQRYGLDDPYLVQYGNWLVSAVSLDFGSSIQTGEPVATVLLNRLPVTFALAGYAGVLVIIAGVPLGLIAGVNAGKSLDRAITAGSTLAISAPSFATGIVLLYVFAVALRWFPVVGAGDGFWDTIWHLTLPAVALALSVIALIVRQIRAVAATVAESDFVLFANARGIARRTLWTRYLLRNSSLPLATSIGLVVGFFLTGTVVIEQTFSLSGLGSLIVTSIDALDVPVVQAVAVLAGLFVLLANLAADLSYMVIDPRVRRRNLT